MNVNFEESLRRGQQLLAEESARELRLHTNVERIATALERIATALEQRAE